MYVITPHAETNQVKRENASCLYHGRSESSTKDCCELGVSSGGTVTVELLSGAVWGAVLLGTMV